MGGLPIVDGVIDGQGCALQKDHDSGLLIFTKPTALEIAEHQKAAKQYQQDRDTRQKELDSLRQRATSDPNFEALLRYLGVI